MYNFKQVRYSISVFVILLSKKKKNNIHKFIVPFKYVYKSDQKNLKTPPYSV